MYDSNYLIQRFLTLVTSENADLFISGPWEVWVGERADFLFECRCASSRGGRSKCLMLYFFSGSRFSESNNPGKLLEVDARKIFELARGAGASLTLRRAKGNIFSDFMTQKCYPRNNCCRKIYNKAQINCRYTLPQQYPHSLQHFVSLNLRKHVRTCSLHFNCSKVTVFSFSPTLIVMASVYWCKGEIGSE